MHFPYLHFQRLIMIQCWALGVIQQQKGKSFFLGPFVLTRKQSRYYPLKQGGEQKGCSETLSLHLQNGTKRYALMHHQFAFSAGDDAAEQQKASNFAGESCPAEQIEILYKPTAPDLIYANQSSLHRYIMAGKLAIISIVSLHNFFFTGIP